MKRYLLVIILLITLLVPLSAYKLLSPVNHAQAATVSVLTQHNDNNRSGANLNETILNTSNVNVNRFGKLFSRPVDGEIYTQALYVPGVNIPNKGIHNVVYVGTMHNTMYAFDADDPTQGQPLWQINLGSSVTLPDPNIGYNCGTYKDISIEIGIVSTPVIDPASQTVFVVALTKENGTYIHRLHALDLATGQHKGNINNGQAVTIQARVSGSGSGSVNNTLSFNSQFSNQRPSLLLTNGNVYLGFSSYCDTGPYHGWLLAYNTTNLQQVAVYNDSPNGSQGGIWMAGQGPASDGTNIYISTGNGTVDTNNGSTLSQAFVKLNASNLSLNDWFVPFNYASLNNVDSDLGSSGLLLIPGTNLMTSGGKQGYLYLVNRTNMGHFHAGNDSQIVQSFLATQGHIHGAPIYWNGPRGPLIYLWAEYSHLVAFPFNGSTLGTTPTTQTTYPAPNGMPGGFLSISANGGNAGSGIVWASLPFSGDANQAVVEGVLRAYDATDLTKELWNSKMNDNRDHYGNFSKFCPPTIANGKVYMPSFSNTLNVYGLLPSSETGLAAKFNNRGISNDSNPSAANLDTFGYSYSAQQLNNAGLAPGNIVVYNNVSFQWPASAPGSSDNVTVAGQTITFPSPLHGSKLAFLGSSTGGATTGTAIATYTDGTTQNFSLGFSDWTLTHGTAQILPGTSIVASLTYRNAITTTQTRNNYIYYTSVPLTAGKALKSVTLPGTTTPGLIHIFSIGVDNGTLGAAFNDKGISDDVNPGAGSFDFGGNSYSSQALLGAGVSPGKIIVVNNVSFTWPHTTPGNPDNLQVGGEHISFPGSPSGSKISFLGSSTNGPSTGSGTIYYKDGTTQAFTLGLSDWTLSAGTVQPLPGNTTFLTTTYRNTPQGKQVVGTDIFYASIPLAAGKPVREIVLPATLNQGALHLFAVTLS